MDDLEQFTQHFIQGLRSVPGYMDSLCDSCVGSCGEQPDDQCLISAWSSYIQGAFDHGHDARETGRRCAVAQLQLQQREKHNRIHMPCDVQTSQ